MNSFEVKVDPIKEFEFARQHGERQRGFEENVSTIEALDYGEILEKYPS